MGRATDDFTRYAETAGLPLPPAGALAGYATEVLAKIPALRAQCDDSARLHALKEMEAVAVGLLRWIELAAERPRPLGQARAVFTTHAEAAGLPMPPQGELGEYAAEMLAQIPALRAGCDEETLHHLEAMEKAARALVRWLRKPPPKPVGPQRPANHQLEQRAAMRAESRSTAQDGWED